MSYFIIGTKKGTQPKRDYYIRVPSITPNSIKWTSDCDKAFGFTHEDAKIWLGIANKWCKCVIIHQVSDDEQDINPEDAATDAYDRAMGVIC